MSQLKKMFGIGQGSSGSAAAQAASAQQHLSGMYNPSANAWVNQMSLNSRYSGHCIHVSDPSMLPPGLAQVSTTLTPSGAGHDVYIDYNSGDIYIVGAAVPGLSREEIDRLKEITEERARATKQAKIDTFKKLPPSIRQMVINHIVWVKTVQEIDVVEAPKTQEQTDLEQKDMRSGFAVGGYGSKYYGGAVAGGFDYGNMLNRAGNIPLPKDLSGDELMRAHNEATLEEELLGNTDSK